MRQPDFSKQRFCANIIHKEGFVTIILLKPSIVPVEITIYTDEVEPENGFTFQENNRKSIDRSNKVTVKITSNDWENSKSQIINFNIATTITNNS